MVIVNIVSADAIVKSWSMHLTPAGVILTHFVENMLKMKFHTHV